MISLEKRGEWFYDQNCRPMDIHKNSFFPQVTACIDDLANNLGIEEKEVKISLNMVLIDLYHRWFYNEFNGGIGYSRDNNCYRVKTRYNRLGIKKIPLLLAVDALTKYEYIDHVKGFKPAQGRGVNSKIRATPRLIELIKSYKIEPDMIESDPNKESIILKDPNGKKLEYKDNEFTDRIREELSMYVERLSKHNITCKGYRDFLKIDTINIRKIFQTDWKSYGRIYGGYWQSSITSDQRKDIMIDDQDTIELDYSNQMVRILYSLIQRDYGDQDAYDLNIATNSPPRRVIKKAIICAINCKDKPTAIKAIQGEINKDSTLKDHPKINISKLLFDLEFKHQDIASLFYSGVGARCQRIDGEIASRIINHFTSIGKPVLSIHDSFICKEEDQQLLFELMHSTFQSVLSINIKDPNSLIK